MPEWNRPGHRVSTWLFLRGLGLVYGIAFWSFATQAPGLVGPHGILPLASTLRAVAVQSAHPLRDLPTLSWIAPDHPPLLGLAWAGLAASAALLLGVAPPLSLAVAWAAYLSVCCDGQVFYDFQWDRLLLEAGLTALCVAPWTWLSSLRRDPEPPRAGRWALTWLLFRLVFASGLVKLASGDPTWRDLSALSYHWWTQPLPTPLSWTLAQLPFWFQRAACAGVFAVELGAPWLFWHPRTRAAGFWAVAGFMALIAATGNFGFFNLLTVVLALPLLDDRHWPAWLARVPKGAGTPGRARVWASTVLAAVLGALSLPLLLAQFGAAPDIPALWTAERAVAPLRSVNTYGLFARMTVERPEIVVEGSADGRTWREYGFRWKPGDPRRAPGWAGPFMPRLDWQMWFAALGPRPEQPWFEDFCGALLEGSAPVLALLGRDPFPGAPPRFLRARLYAYTFTDRATRAATGCWWRRTLVGPY